VKNNKSDISLIASYLNGELDDRAMYQLERRAQEDPALMDMLIGMEASKEHDDQIDFSTIDQMISNRIQENKSVKMLSWKSWVVAASLLLISGITGFLLLRKPQQIRHDHTLTAIRKKQAESVIQGTIVEPKSPVHQEDVAILRKHSPLRLPEKPLPVVRDSNTIAAVSVARDSDIFSGQALNEIVVTGYVAKRKTDITSSSTTMSRPADRQETLAGRVAGIRIRGTNSGEEVNDTLFDTQQSLNEVVVLSTGKKAALRAYPLIGWEAYKKYLQQQATLNVGTTGKVTLAFTIDAAGNPVKIRIVKGINDALNNRAIHLVLSGSRWNRGGKDVNKEIRLKIKFH